MTFDSETDSGSESETTTTTFTDDGTQIENPHTDALGYEYKTTEDWVDGTNKYDPEPTPNHPGEETAAPVDEVQ